MNNKIKELVQNLNKQGIKTTEIIKNSGVSRTQFYATLNGTNIPKLDTANSICKALKADIEEVFPELKNKEIS